MLTPGPRPDRVTLGIGLMICFALFGPVIDAFAKLVPPEVPVGQIAGARFLIQALIFLPMAGVMGWLHVPGTREILRHLARAALILGATILFFLAIRVMPLADAIAIFFVEPFILTLLGGLILGEPIGPRRIIACLVGFTGALLIVKPSFAEFGLVATLPLGTAACFAVYMILTRSMAKAMHPVTLQAYTALAALVLVLPLLWVMDGTANAVFDPVLPTARALWLLLGVGIAASLAHLFISFALAFAPAATIAPLQYLEIVSATTLGYLIFDDLPDTLTFAGIAIIAGSGLYVFQRERDMERRVPPIP